MQTFLRWNAAQNVNLFAELGLCSIADNPALRSKREFCDQAPISS